MGSICSTAYSQEELCKIIMKLLSVLFQVTTVQIIHKSNHSLWATGSVDIPNPTWLIPQFIVKLGTHIREVCDLEKKPEQQQNHCPYRVMRRY